ncbi:MAG TPA: SRPBCC domain-containing protein [Candidatus Saccharimonadales bacterium]
MDFKVGGTEFNEGKFHNGVTHTFKAVYYDLVPDKRIIYAYEMYLDGKRISVSLSTIELTEQAGVTTLTLHESGAFLDGLDSPTSREQGTNALLDTLESSLNS